MNEGEKQRGKKKIKEKKRRGKRKTRGRLREFEEEEVARALAGEGGEEPRAEPLASALPSRGTPERDLWALPKKVIGRFGAAPLENASRPLAEAEERETTGRAPLPVPASLPALRMRRDELRGRGDISAPLGQDEALRLPLARPGDTQTPSPSLLKGSNSLHYLNSRQALLPAGPKQFISLRLTNPTAATDALRPNEER